MKITAQKYLEPALAVMTKGCLLGLAGATFCALRGVEPPLKGAAWAVFFGAITYGLNEWKQSNPGSLINQAHPLVPIYLSIYAASYVTNFRVNEGINMVGTVIAMIAVGKLLHAIVSFSQPHFTKAQIQ